MLPDLSREELGNQEGHKNQQPLIAWATKKKHTLSLETSKSRKKMETYKNLGKKETSQCIFFI